LMTNRERFQRVMNFETVDRLPVVEWASWWDKTIERWHREGLPAELTEAEDIRDFFGLDVMRQRWISPLASTCPAPASHGAPLVTNRAEYIRIKPHLYPTEAFDRQMVREWAKRQATGEMVVWITLEGFFWFPRSLLGIEGHLYAFYDQPDLIKEINEDVLQFNIRVLREFSEICIPDFMTFGEDMSYNHGPMLSKSQFDEFMAPYYRRIVPEMIESGTVPFVDTDGDVTVSAGWFLDVGVQGILPLERMAGVDVSDLRRKFPKLMMIGAFDKTTMHLGEARMRQEFERLMPIMRQGGFISGVDHQTPPEVSLEDYRLYLRLLREYCEMAVR
jgi:hypothetical protein